jgi:hypothetical protein
VPVNNFNVGKDVSIDIDTGEGPIEFALLTGFSARQDSTDLRVKGLDGLVRHMYLPDGWSGTFEMERGPVEGNGSDVDTFFADLEEKYYTASPGDVGLGAMTITEIISEPGGGVSTYRYDGVQLKLDDAGSWSGDNTVKMSVSWMAARRKKVS